MPSGVALTKLALAAARDLLDEVRKPQAVLPHCRLEGRELAPRTGIELLGGVACLPLVLPSLQGLLLHLRPEGEA